MRFCSTFSLEHLLATQHDFFMRLLFPHLYRDWLAFAFSEKVSDPDGAQHPEGRSGHRGQTPFPQLLCCRGIVANLLLVVFITGNSSHAGDWPQILGINRDGHAADETIPAWTQPPTVRWRVDCGAGYAGVAVAEGKVLLWHRVGKEEHLDCLAADNGKRLWRASFPAIYRGGVDADQGPRCVPVVDTGNVFVYGAAGDLHAVSLADGKTIWSRQLRSDYDAEDGYFGAGSTPIVVGSSVIILIGGRNNAGIVAVDSRDGKTRWTSTDQQASYASPVTLEMDGKTLVAAVMGLVTVIIDPETGKVLRQFDFGRRGPVVNAATPLVDQTRLFVTASYGIGCRMVDVANDPPTDLWQSRDVVSSQYASPVRSGDHIFAITGREDVGDAGLICVGWSDGKVAWSRPDFGTGHLIIAGDRVLAQLTSGRLDLFAADSTGYRQLATTDLPSGSYRSLPAVANGLIFCRRTLSPTAGELVVLQPQ